MPTMMGSAMVPRELVNRMDITKEDAEKAAESLWEKFQEETKDHNIPSILRMGLKGVVIRVFVEGAGWMKKEMDKRAMELLEEVISTSTDIAPIDPKDAN